MIRTRRPQMPVQNHSRPIAFVSARSRLSEVRLDSPETRHCARATLTEQQARANSPSLHLVTSMTEITYRLAARNDVRFICELGQEVNRLHHEVWPQIFAAPSEPQRDEELWLRAIEGDGSATFIAEKAKRPIGFVTCQLIDETNTLAQPIRYCRIGTVCVVADERGHGVGRSLMRLVEDWGTSKGAVDTRVIVWKFNARAVKLYEELGYVVRSMTLGKLLSRATP